MPVGMKFDKKMFFDREAVANIVGKHSAKALGKAGAFAQRRARSSMRRAGKKAMAARAATGLGAGSPAGSPPKAWSTDKVATLKNIQFAFDPARMSVFVGPLRLNGRKGLVPSLMEWGGQVRRSSRDREIMAAKINRLNGMGRDISGRFRKRGAKPLEAGDIKSTVTYAPRPFMGPAVAKEAPKFPTLFAK